MLVSNQREPICVLVEYRLYDEIASDNPLVEFPFQRSQTKLKEIGNVSNTRPPISVTMSRPCSGSILYDLLCPR